jgi:hypothetical protein
MLTRADMDEVEEGDKHLFSLLQAIAIRCLNALSVVEGASAEFTLHLHCTAKLFEY